VLALSGLLIDVPLLCAPIALHSAAATAKDIGDLHLWFIFLCLCSHFELIAKKKLVMTGRVVTIPKLTKNDFVLNLN